MLIFVVNILPARTFWNSTHCLLSHFTLDWSRNLWHNPMWNMAVNNISYPIYPLSTRTEKGYIVKMIPFFLFFFVQYNNTLHYSSIRFYLAYPIWTYKAKLNQSYSMKFKSTNKIHISHVTYQSSPCHPIGSRFESSCHSNLPIKFMSATWLTSAGRIIQSVAGLRVAAIQIYQSNSCQPRDLPARAVSSNR